MVIELEPDMVTVKVGPRIIAPYAGNGQSTSFEGHEFFEASSMRKVGEQYYFVYSSINGHELCYATSDRPDGGFTYGGTLISNGDIYLDGRTDEESLNYTGNNHGSIVEIEGQWYVFYHRQTNRHQFSRQVCAEKITIEAYGTIKQVEMTSCGLNQGPLVGKGSYEARIACILMSRNGAKRYEFGDIIEDYHPYFTQERVDREENPNQYIANMTDGSVAGFKYFDCETMTDISITVRGTGNGVMKIKTDMKEEAICQIPVSETEVWKAFHASAKLQDGVNPLYFIYEGEGYVDFLEFELK
jgi:hypothetical protein